MNPAGQSIQALALQPLLYMNRNMITNFSATSLFLPCQFTFQWTSLNPICLMENLIQIGMILLRLNLDIMIYIGSNHEVESV